MIFIQYSLGVYTISVTQLFLLLRCVHPAAAPFFLQLTQHVRNNNTCGWPERPVKHRTIFHVTARGHCGAFFRVRLLLLYNSEE